MTKRSSFLDTLVGNKCYVTEEKPAKSGGVKYITREAGLYEKLFGQTHTVKEAGLVDKIFG